MDAVIEVKKAKTPLEIPPWAHVYQIVELASGRRFVILIGENDALNVLIDVQRCVP